MRIASDSFPVELRRRPIQLLAYLFSALLLSICVFTAISSAQSHPAQTRTAKAHPATTPAVSDPNHLAIYSVDVEGGQATLFVAPSGASLLVDTGWPGSDGRDALRILAAMHDAGIARIDHVLITHFHDDHVGGVPELVKRVHVGEFLDHGVNREDSDATRENFAAYELAIKDHPRRIVHPGDTISIPGLSIIVITADGEHISTVPGTNAAPNAYCGAEQKWPDDPSENARSVGILVAFDKFRLLDLGDLTGAKEVALGCPINPIGGVDLYMVSHHGLSQSNSRALVDAIHPRVAIMNNGAHKGGSPEAWQIVHNSPGLEDLWQLHTAEDSDAAHNSPTEQIANLAGTAEDGAWLKVAASPDGSFSVTNSRTGQSKQYPHK
jgi:competence protein ComEC